MNCSNKAKKQKTNNFVSLSRLCLDTTDYYGCGYNIEGGPYRMYLNTPNLTGPGLGIAFLIITGIITVCGNCVSLCQEGDGVKEIPDVKITSHISKEKNVTNFFSLLFLILSFHRTLEILNIFFALSFFLFFWNSLTKGLNNTNRSVFQKKLFFFNVFKTQYIKNIFLTCQQAISKSSVIIKLKIKSISKFGPVN